ncbi:hypothetical protein Q5425_37075 [Amycolatopsis sp. A133]|uniref:hypothetical protein n=1 Tax=Amycolatopsis sp. A133 TaxID=3064472 RepID=UPI0027F64709|nr:hypothetical protein [Amycolatopsis sp. A133]MDQ7809371.1 hypothetical protein [Amycolatopsis sp. A133]
MRSPRQRERDDRRSAAFDAWAARHRLLMTSLATVLFAWFAWYLSVRRDGATAGEIVFWELIVVPIGTVSAWLALTRIRRRNRSRS